MQEDVDAEFEALAAQMMEESVMGAVPAAVPTFPAAPVGVPRAAPATAAPAVDRELAELEASLA
jgi:hypothetical protein